MKPEDRTKYLIQALGWQGGTVHQACAEIGVPVHDFLYNDVTGDDELNSDYMNGVSAVRTCSKEFFHTTLAPKHKGNLQFWFGVCSGWNLSHLLGEEQRTWNKRCIG